MGIRTAAIDRSNPVNRTGRLGRALIFFWSAALEDCGRRMQNLVTGERAAFNSANTWIRSRKRDNKYAIVGTGSNSQITFGTAINSKFSTALTVEAVYTPTDVAAYHGIAEENNQVGGFPWGLRTNPSAKTEWYSSTFGGLIAAGATTLVNGTTYHFCGTLGSNNGAVVYLNGVSDGTTTYNGSSVSSSVALNILGAGGTFAGQGYLEFLKIYNVEASPREVKELWLATKGPRRDFNYLESPLIVKAAAAAAGGSAGNLLLLGCGA